ncbi:MAG TPA: stage II sporulation protein SpoIID, partial [Bacillota bacterium]
PVDDSDLDGAVPAEVKFWEARLSGEQIRSAVAEAGGSDPGPVQQVEVASWSDDGRAVTLRVNGVEVPAVAFRLAAGSTEFRSTMIQEIEPDGNGFVFRGKGYGHGVGLPQWSARVLAERGASAEEIIERYYPGTQVVSLWD